MGEDVENSNSLILIKNSKQQIFLIMYVMELLNQTLKRIFDLIIGICGVLILIPVTLFVFIMKVILREKGKLFYSQQRIGKNGKLFKLYKYRTMVANSEEMLEKLLKEKDKIKQEYDKYKKIQDDPRITKFGNFLRRTSLDEFPQFINVLIGNMSMVGPRPYLPKERDDMGYFYYYIIKSKPGITGLWQISGRNKCSFQKRLELEMEYSKNKSIIKDIAILLKTIKGVLKKDGAI